MKLYGKKFFRRAMDQEAQYRRETRDGIVWEHLPDQRLARVKIQGSNEIITAWYPENWQKTPVFLKPGNAVRITHVGGHRSRIEIVGHGLTVPTPVGGGMFPDMGAGADYWVSGGGLLATETPSLRVRVLPGTIRVDGFNYVLTFDPTMGDDMEMGDGVVIGSGIGIDEIDPPPPFIPYSFGDSAQYRYDAFVVGADGVIDYLKGTAVGYPSEESIAKPAIPAGHVLIGDYILVYSGMTAILQSDIGRDFTPPSPSRLVIITSYTMDWHEPDLVWDPNPPDPHWYEVPHPTHQWVDLRMIDQYGNPAILTDVEYLFHLEFPQWIAGNGWIGHMSIAGTVYDPGIEPITGYGSYGLSLGYKRQNADGNEGYADDVTPGLHAYVDYNGIRYDAATEIKLLDDSGLVMIYGARVPLNP